MSDSQLTQEDRDLIKAGYKPQLLRTLGFWSTFAASFSFMSVLMGIFVGYGFMLSYAGPFGIWMWPIVGFCQLLVALIFAEMAARLPLTGSIYNWNTKLSFPAIGWIAGFLLLFTYAIGGVGVIVILIPPLQTLTGQTFDATMFKCIGIGIIIAQTVINIIGVKLAAYINKLAVIGEIIILAVFSVALLIAMSLTGQFNASLLTTIPHTPVPYWPAFLMAILLPAFTIFGFETSSDISEETLHVKSVAPKSIITSVLATIIIGFIFLIILTLAMTNPEIVTKSADPLSAINTLNLGVMPTKVFLIFVLIAMFAGGLINNTTATRLLFAMSRDNHFLGASIFKKVSAHRVPRNAGLAIMSIQIILLLTISSATAMFASAVVLLAVVYLITVLNFTFNAKKLPPSTTFSLGKWRWPVISLAVIWLVAEIAILTIPAEFHESAIIAGYVIVAGVLLYLLIKYLPKKR